MYEKEDLSPGEIKERATKLGLEPSAADEQVFILNIVALIKLFDKGHFRQRSGKFAGSARLKERQKRHQTECQRQEDDKHHCNAFCLWTTVFPFCNQHPTPPLNISDSSDRFLFFLGFYGHEP